MKIFIKQIPEAGLVLDQTVTASDLDLPADVLECLAPLSVHGIFDHFGDEVLAKMSVHGKYRVSCVKCLDEFDVEKTDEFEMVFDIESNTEFIDFTDDVRSEIILAASFNPLCVKDCKGLCVNCGVNLNKEKCQCNEREGVKA